MIGVCEVDQLHDSVVCVGLQLGSPVGEKSVDVEHEVLHSVEEVVVDERDHLAQRRLFDRRAEREIVALLAEIGEELDVERVGITGVQRADLVEVVVGEMTAVVELVLCDDHVLVCVMHIDVSLRFPRMAAHPDVSHALSRLRSSGGHVHVPQIEQRLHHQRRSLAVAECIHQQRRVARLEVRICPVELVARTTHPHRAFVRASHRCGT